MVKYTPAKALLLNAADAAWGRARFMPPPARMPWSMMLAPEAVPAMTRAQSISPVCPPSHIILATRLES
jgi:hypothetical protein